MRKLWIYKLFLIILLSGQIFLLSGQRQNGKSTENEGKIFNTGLNSKGIIDSDGELKFLGYIQSLTTIQISDNSWTIGCEVLDRDYACYTSYKDYLPELGAKTARLQLGWAKCEKQKGIYNFGWIKEIVEDLKAKKIRPWLQFSYGNPIYEGGGEPALAGGIPYSDEALHAWDNWVRKTVSQFKDYTNYWEVWNEPNLPDKKNSVKTPEEYGKFFIRTAEIVKQLQPDAIISGLALCGMHTSSFEYIIRFLEYLKNSGKLELLDEMTYHPYPKIPEETYPLADSLRSVLLHYSSKIKIKHGETGCPSAFNSAGILANHEWTGTSQSKWLLRRMCGDYANNIPTSIFTIIDYTYPVTKSLGQSYTLKAGLLGSDNLKQVSTIRSSFYAVRNAINLLDEKWQSGGIPEFYIEIQTDSIKIEDIYLYQFNQKNSNRKMIMIWSGNKVPGNSLRKIPVNLSLKDIHFSDPVIIDLLDGRVFSTDKTNPQLDENSNILVNIPFYDSPIMITEKQEISIMQQRKVALPVKK